MSASLLVSMSATSFGALTRTFPPCRTLAMGARGIQPRMDVRRPPTFGGGVPQLAAWQAAATLNVVTVIWGSQHAIMKDLIADASPSSVNAARFCIAALAALPFLPGAPWRQRPPEPPPSALAAAAAAAEEDEEKRPLVVALEPELIPSAAVSGQWARTWAAGAELGCWSFLGFALQAIGLQTTTASRSAFLLYLNVKLVPLVALLVYGRASPARTWLSAAIALAGTALLSYDGSPPNIGDAWSVAAALASACFILRLEEAAKDDGIAADELNAATIAVSAALTSAWAAAELAAQPDGLSIGAVASVGASLLNAEHLPALFYLAIVTTAVAQWLQTLGQSRVSAQDAALIYALDPVYAAAFAYLLLGETLGPQGLAGGGLVMSAVLLSRAPRGAPAEGRPPEASAAAKMEMAPPPAAEELAPAAASGRAPRPPEGQKQR